MKKERKTVKQIRPSRAYNGEKPERTLEIKENQRKPVKNK